MTKIKIISIFLWLAAMNLTAQTYSGGSGTQADPYLISSKADMETLANEVNSGKNSYSGKYFRLTQSLTGANALATSVGFFNENIARYFEGVFDGNGYEIALDNAPYGVFGYIVDATIQNLGVSGVVSFPTTSNASPDVNIAGICGSSQSSTIVYCCNTANVSAVSTNSNAFVGGICGYAMQSIIKDCFNMGSVSCSAPSISGSGGICGTNYQSNILNCYNTGNISAVSQGDYCVIVSGGISIPVGISTIENCFSSNTSIESKYNSGSHCSMYIGRIVSYLSDYLSNNYALSTMVVNGTTINSSDATSINGANASLANFKSQSWIQSKLGWDFNTVWQMSSTGSAFQGFPILKTKTIPVYTITATSNVGGNITPSGSILVNPNNNQTFTFTPNTGYEINQVLVDGVNNATAVSTGSYTFTNVTTNHIISVTFKQKPSNNTWQIGYPNAADVIATLDNNGAMTISGTGAMKDFTDYTTQPWYSIRNSIKTLNIQQGVSSIGNRAFIYCSELTSITFPNSMQTISEAAFAYCSGLTSVTIPNSVKTIGVSAFQACGSLTAINVDASNPAYFSENGVLFSKDKTVLFCYPAGKKGAYSIPNSVQNLSYYAFNSCIGLTSVTIPNSVRTINDYYVFSYCTGLTDVTVNWDTPLSVPSNTFEGVTVANVNLHIPDGKYGLYAVAPVWKDFNILFECLPNIVIQVWDDVLSVISNPANNGGYTFTGYQWLKNGAEIPGATSGNLYLANDPAWTSAQYTCRLTTSTGLTLQTCPLQSLRSAVNVYPNPTQGKVTIESSTLKQGDRIDVYSITGTPMKQITASSRQTEIDLGNLPKGIYIVNVNGKQVKIILL